MKTLIVATTPTHHTSRALRLLNLETYKQFGSGVHQAVEDFRTMEDAKNHLKNRETHEVSVKFVSGLERLEYKNLGYLKY